MERPHIWIRSELRFLEIVKGLQANGDDWRAV